jgi:histone H1/5
MNPQVFPAGGTLQSDVTSPLAVTNKKKNKATPDLAIARSKVFDVDILPTSSDVKTETRKPLPDKKVASAKKSVLETASTPSSSSSKQSKKTMTELVHEAIHAIKDRTGSSVPAITKYIIATYPDMEENNTFKSRLSQALKKGVASNHFNKIKCSYKISAEWAQKEKERKRKANAKKVAEKKKRNSMSEKQRNEAEAKRIEELANTLDPEELEKLKKQHTAKVERQKKKEEAERIAKERAERLRKRRFPMEDTRLHLEDKELNVSPPASVKRRPGVPYLFQVARDSKSTAMGPSRCDAMDHESRGLVPDMLQVYHFFRGDVGFNEVEGKKIVADFALKHLIYAVDEILNGNARKSKLVPPLITHLFVVSLQILTAPGTSLGDHGHGEQLAKDLSCLNAALNPASWSEVCVMYMECMERYYTTPASLDSNVLAPGVTDVNYLFRFTNSPDLIRSNRVPGGYFGYRKSTLAKAFDKLNKQDPWTLSAEELMALLRSLTDDILASRPDIMLDMTER